MQDQESIDELQDTLQRIELESLSRGFMDEDMLCANFGQQERVKMKTLYERWRELRNYRGNGEFDRALAAGDIDAIQRILSELTKLNVCFLRLATNRLQELSFELPGSVSGH